MKTKNKFLKYCCLIGATIGIATPAVALLSSCASGPKQFTLATSNDIFANSVTQLGSSFTDSPSTTEFQSAYGSLVTYVNEGDYVYDAEKHEYSSKPNARLVLEAATKIVVYGKKTTTNNEVQEENQETVQSKSSGTLVEENAVLFTADSSNFDSDGFKKETDGSYSINTEKFGQAMVNATKVEFTLNKDLSWVDKNGVAQQSLVPKDFLDSLKGYKQSSDYGLNANGYFLDLAGIDYDATIKHVENESKEAGGTFTYIIGNTTKTPYFLDILNKQLFFPIPYSHPDTAGTLETPETSSALKFIDSNGKKIIDKNSSDWTRVYGGAQEKGVDVWSIGPYYISHSSQQDVTFSINKNYFDAMQSMYDMNKLDIRQKIPTVIKKYKAGDPATIYNKFNSGELSFAPVPQAQSSEAAIKYQNSESLISVPASKPSRARYIGYNLGIFKEDGTLKNDKIVDTQFQKFIKNFHSENSLKIRKGLNELINWAALSEIKYSQGTKDFSLSSIPYATFSINESGNDSSSIDYYEAVMNNKSLKVDENSSTIQQQANTNTSSLVPKGIVGGKASKMKASSDKILNDDTSLKTDFDKALKDEGYTKNAPLKLDYWTLDQSKDPKDTAYFTEVANQINTLSDGAIQFTYHEFNTNSVNYIYYDKAVAMGDMLWGPDYNGLGTWVGLYFEYEFGSNNKPIEIKASSTPTTTSSSSGTASNDNWDTLKSTYHITNLWKPLYDEMKKAKNANTQTQPLQKANVNTNEITTNNSSWLVKLYDYLVEKKAITTTTTETDKATTTSTETYKDIAPNLSTEISIWAGLSQSNGVNLVNWIDSKYPILPMYQTGLDYQGYKLVDPKYTVILNLNGDVNYRDFVLNTPISD